MQSSLESNNSIVEETEEKKEMEERKEFGLCGISPEIDSLMLLLFHTTVE